MPPPVDYFLCALQDDCEVKGEVVRAGKSVRVDTPQPVCADDL